MKRLKICNKNKAYLALVDRYSLPEELDVIWVHFEPFGGSKMSQTKFPLQDAFSNYFTLKRKNETA